MKTKRKTDATASARRLAPLSLCVARTALQYLHALMADPRAAAEAAAEQETADLAGDGASAPTHQGVAHPVHDERASRGHY